MDNAEALGATNPTAANKLWAQDRQAGHRPVAGATLFTPKNIDFVSKRVGNFTFSDAVLLAGRPGLGAVSGGSAATALSDGRSPSIEVQAGGAGESRAVGLGPCALARRRLLRNRAGDGVARRLRCSIVVACLAAPIYAHDIAHTDPFTSNVDGTTIVNGKTRARAAAGAGASGSATTPIGPTWDLHHYFLGADDQGRDVMARLLYGGRNSLLIGIASALICCLLATIVAVVAGFFGGLVDGILSRLLDVVWAFPVYLLAISISDRRAHERPRARHRHAQRGQPVAADRDHRRSSTSRTSRARFAARCCRCGRRSSSRRRSPRAPRTGG